MFVCVCGWEGEEEGVGLRVGARRDESGDGWRREGKGRRRKSRRRKRKEGLERWLNRKRERNWDFRD